MKKLLSISLLSALLLAGCSAHQHEYNATVIQPTCTEMGYTVHTCSCGDVYFSNYRTTATHSYGEWITGVAATLTHGGEEYRICKSCGALQTHDTGNLSALPKVYLSSDGSVFFSQGDLYFTCESNARIEEGKSEIQLLFTKNGGLFPVDLGWGEQSAYRLDPCTPDLTYARAAAAEALANFCKSVRDSAGDTPSWYPALTGGGFLVQVYHDEAYMGLYRLTPPAGDWAYASANTQNSLTAVFYGGLNTEECLFTTNLLFDAEGFTLQYCSTEDSKWAKDSFESFADFLRLSSEDGFKEGLEAYTDLTVLMDHFLMATLFGSGEGDTAGTLWTTVDGVHWLPSFAHLHTAYGLNADGVQTKGDPGLSPLGEDGSIVYQGENLLWKRLCQSFGEELKTRYTQLRATLLLSPDLLYQSFLQQGSAPEQELLELEKELLPALAPNAVQAETIKKYIEDRLYAMDSWLGIVG